ncbi:MAG: hypothetical protein DRO92_04690 [Candidatus Altiarchaeales archaeon]|nr:MAG: hypothetical protein DRO92_04690 [Candidatus Altiarchaeales archaeon]
MTFVAVMSDGRMIEFSITKAGKVADVAYEFRGKGRGLPIKMDKVLLKDTLQKAEVVYMKDHDWREVTEFLKLAIECICQVHNKEEDLQR